MDTALTIELLPTFGAPTYKRVGRRKHAHAASNTRNLYTTYVGRKKSEWEVRTVGNT